MAFWTLEEQQMIKPISGNNLEKFEQLQNEVQMHDFQLMVGFEFYQELLRNPENYSVLLNGGTYTRDGILYRFEGLKVVLSYLLYSQYVRQSYLNDTFSGFVAHTGDGFQRISAEELRNQEAMYKQKAGTIWDECKQYLLTLDLVYFPQKSTRKFRMTTI